MLKSRSSRGSVESLLTNGAASKKNLEVDASANGSSTPEAPDEGPIGAKPPNRLSTMKKAAEEQRRKVRETRLENILN